MLPGGGHLWQSFGLSPDVDEREADECRLHPRVRKWSLGVTEALEGSLGLRSSRGTKIPWGSCLDAILEHD